MIQILARYVEVLLHPFSVHARLRLGRQGQCDLDESLGISLEEAISVSWIWNMIQGFTILLTIYISSQVYEDMESNSALASFLLDSWQQASMRLAIMSVLLGMVFFPVYELLFVKINSAMIKFFSELFAIPATEQQIEEVVRFALVGNIFLLLPVLGRVVSFFSTGLYLFAGLRNNLGLTGMQCIVVMGAPLLGFFLLIGFTMTAAAVMLSVLF